MRGRRTVWSDPGVQKLAQEFVLAADEVWRLQGGFDAARWRADGGTDKECLTFQKLAADGHYGPGAGSKQGIYVCTPAGKLLASINSTRPRSVARTLRTGLRRWQELQPSERDAPVADAQPDRRPDWARPEGGLALTVTLRYLPASGNPKAIREREYNYDACWFTAAEARRLLPAKIETGAEGDVPGPLFRRIARFHLVDAVRGETRPNQTVGGALRCRVTDVADGVAQVEFRGQAEAKNRPRSQGLYRALGIEAELLGTARWNLKSKRFDAFRMVGLGVRWADARRRRGTVGGLQSRRIGWLFELTPEDRVPVAPTHLGSYGVSWVHRRPR